MKEIREFIKNVRSGDLKTAGENLKKAVSEKQNIRIKNTENQ